MRRNLLILVFVLGPLFASFPIHAQNPSAVSTPTAPKPQATPDLQPPVPAAGDPLYAPVVTSRGPQTLHERFIDYAIVTVGPRTLFVTPVYAAIRMADPPAAYPRDWRRGASALVRLNPEDQGAYIELGMRLYFKGPLDWATSQFREVVRERPDQAKLHAALGSSLSQNLKLFPAIAEYREAVSLKPDDTAAKEQLDYLMKEKGQLDIDVAKLREWLRRKPDDREAADLLAFLLTSAGDLDAPVTVLAQLVRLKPNDVYAYERFTTFLELSEPRQQVVRELRERVRSQPQSSGAHAALGKVLLKSDELDGAANELQEAARLQPESPEIHLQLSFALRQKGNEEGAKRESALAEQLKGKASSEPETAALNLVRILNAACETYRTRYGSYPPDLKSLGMPNVGISPSAAAADLIDPVLAYGMRNGYQFIYKGIPNANGEIESYDIRAEPKDYPAAGPIYAPNDKRKHFSTDQSGFIR